MNDKLLGQVVHLPDMPLSYHMRFQYQNNQYDLTLTILEPQKLFYVLLINGVRSKSAFVG